MAGATGRTLVTLSFSSNISSTFTTRFSLHAKRFPFHTLSNPITRFPRFRTLSTITTFPETIDSENVKHSLLLERLRIRHLKDNSGKIMVSKSSEKKGVVVDFDVESEIGKKKKVMTFGSFEELGLSDEVMGAVREMGIQIPCEIQCIGVPAVLDHKSVVLGSHTGSGKTLAYLLPLVQLLFFVVQV